MQNLSRRSSGVYVTRLTVPERLRPVIGKRELIASTGVRELALAKIVATVQLAQWRRQFFELERARLSLSMNHDTLLKIATGDPVLAHGGYLTLGRAAAACGLEEEQLLRVAASGKLGLHLRLSGVPGVLIPLSLLPVEPGIGIREIPVRSRMPAEAVDHYATGVFVLDRGDAPSIAEAFLTGDESASVVLLLGGTPDQVFVPDDALVIAKDALEVEGSEVESIRRAIASKIDPAELQAARSAHANAAAVAAANALAAVTATSSRASAPGSKHAEKRLSDAVDAFARNFLVHKRKTLEAVAPLRRELELLIEFEGDRKLSEIDADVLRDFRDNKLSTFLARENHARNKFGTTSMKASIAASAGTWPVMSVAERDVRMQRITAMFRWLHDQKWIQDDPGTALRGESVASKAVRARAAVVKVEREPFTPEELQQIFSVKWFQTGKGELTASNTYREFQPFQFWLPLLGLFAGCRSGEASQLWLDDLKQTEAGTWYLDINKFTADKDLKTDRSTRKVPVHPLLLQAGLVEWRDALRGAGFARLFPELSWSPTLEYSKEPVRKHSELFGRLGMPRDGTKVFHSFRHNFNNALERMSDVKDVARKRLMGHLPGEGVNERHYLNDRLPDETAPYIAALDFKLPAIAIFDVREGLRAVNDALRRKQGERRGREDMGPLTK